MGGTTFNGFCQATDHFTGDLFHKKTLRIPGTQVGSQPSVKGYLQMSLPICNEISPWWSINCWFSIGFPQEFSKKTIDDGRIPWNPMGFSPQRVMASWSYGSGGCLAILHLGSNVVDPYPKHGHRATDQSDWWRHGPIYELMIPHWSATSPSPMSGLWNWG